MNSNIVALAPDRPEDSHTHDGYVYVIEFSNGTIKVGKASNLRRRMIQHRSYGERFGLNITRYWGSPLHRGYECTEASLIKKACELGTVQGGREYFTGASFDSLVTFCRGLNLTPSTQAQVAEDNASREHGRDQIRNFVQSIWGDRHVVSVKSDLQAFVLRLFFDERTPLPDLHGDLSESVRAQLIESAQDTASTLGHDPDAIHGWSSREWLFHLLDVTVHAAKLEMQVRISNEDRDDLLDPWFGEAL